MSGVGLHAGNLPPKPAVDDRQVQVEHGLPLDQNPADLEVPKPQRPTHESHPELQQRIKHPTLPLVYVHDKELPHDEIFCADKDSH